MAQLFDCLGSEAFLKSKKSRKSKKIHHQQPEQCIKILHFRKLPLISKTIIQYHQEKKKEKCVQTK